MFLERGITLSLTMLFFQGLCHEMAVEKGMQHAQLPIGQYIEMKSRRILTVNHG